MFRLAAAFTAGALGAQLCWLATRSVFAAPALVRSNWRGREVPTAVGVLIPLVVIAVEAGRAVLGAFGAGTAGTTPARVAVLVTVVGFALLGAIDDVAGSADQGAGLYDVVSRKRRGSLTGHTNWIQELEYSPDGTIIATASDDYTIRLWNASTGKTVRVLTGHTAPVYEVAFSPDGRILASASEDRTVRLWDSANGSRLGRLSDRSQKMNAVAFSSDGKTLASAAADGSVRLWSEILWRDLRELHATVCNALLTGISRSDWRQYAGDIPYRQSCP